MPNSTWFIFRTISIHQCIITAIYNKIITSIHCDNKQAKTKISNARKISSNFTIKTTADNMTKFSLISKFYCCPIYWARCDMYFVLLWFVVNMTHANKVDLVIDWHKINSIKFQFIFIRYFKTITRPIIHVICMFLLCAKAYYFDQYVYSIHLILTYFR